MLKRILITLLILSPIVMFAFEVLYAQPQLAPPHILVGRWDTEAEHIGPFGATFTLHEDGTVEGSVGDTTMHDALFKRNRGWLFKTLGFATDYIIVGDLAGSVITEVQCAGFQFIVSDFSDREIRGDLDCRECGEDGEKQSLMGAGPGSKIRLVRAH